MRDRIWIKETWRPVGPWECRKDGATIQYALGFPHNNCGGGCVKAGISHFVHLYHRLPATFTKWESEEQETIKDLKKRGVSSWHYTILKDRRGGETKPLSLQSLRIRIESGELFPTDEWGGCGCGGATQQAA
jgi:hypothetical protein